MSGIISSSSMLELLDAADREFWLGHCEGFAVEFADGHAGEVAYVRYQTSHTRPDALVVRSGWPRREEIVINSSDVELIDPRFDLVRLSIGRGDQRGRAASTTAGVRRWLDTHRPHRRTGDPSPRTH